MIQLIEVHYCQKMEFVEWMIIIIDDLIRR
jgi:hypothetical protein